MSLNSPDRQAARLALVHEHIEQENRHDLASLLATFGEHPTYDDAPWGERHEGLDGVRAYYQSIFDAVPDLAISIHRESVAEDTVILEVEISGTHRGWWRGLPPTGRHLGFPLCAVYTFTADDKLAGERVYYDRLEVFRQLGFSLDPMTSYGRLVMGVTHPRLLVRTLLHRVTGLLH